MTPGRADWGTFRDRGDGYCQTCGRTIRWHAGQGCYSPTSTGMPGPAWKHSTACGIFEDEPGWCTCKQVTVFVGTSWGWVVVADVRNRTQ